MSHLANEPADATPLTREEAKGLLLPVLTRAELNRAEIANILGAMSWVWQIRIDTRNLLADAHAWLADASAARYSSDECAVRFGHQLVAIHRFRTATDDGPDSLPMRSSLRSAVLVSPGAGDRWPSLAPCAASTSQPFARQLPAETSRR